MIITDGKTGYVKVRSGREDDTQSAELLKLISEKLDGAITGKFDVLLDEIRKSRGRGGSEAISDDDAELTDAESLKHIANLMAAKKGIDSTNIVNLGSKQDIKDDKGNRNKTIDLLGDVL